MEQTTQRCHDPYLRCALYGAAQTALGIKGCCVLSHSPQGCQQLVDAAFGWQDADYTETELLCTKLCEVEIVHGGEDLLARTILEGRELNVPVMFVLTACGPEIVGDDIEAVCDELRAEVDFELVPVQSAGFRGDQNWGTDLALQAVVEHLVPAQAAASKRPRSVCLIAPHANANPTWMGDLAWTRDVLKRMGVSDVVNLTHDTTLEELAKVAQCEACLVLSHDAGQQAADDLSTRFEIEQWCEGLPLPIGFTHTRNWLLELGRSLGAEEAARKLIAEGESMVVQTCRRKGLQQSAMHRAPAAIVADATVGIPLVRFVCEDLEMVPQLVCLRSGQGGTHEMLARELDELALDPQVVYDADVYQVRSALAGMHLEMVLGSNIERHAVRELEIPYVFRLVNPVSSFRLSDRAYWGYTGILNLIEIMQNEWWDRYRSKRQRYKARW